MLRRSLYRKLLWGLAIGIAFCAYSRESRAQNGSLTVAAGYDLFETTTGSQYTPTGGTAIPLVGVPLGTYDFGSGPVATGDTDTIVQRLSAVTVTAVGLTGSTGLMLDALQMETAVPVNLGAGTGFYFFSLQPGNASTGTMAITFTSLLGGTFTSSLNINFDITFGALNGPLVATASATLSNAGAQWGRIPPPGAVVITGVNYLLDGKDTNQDFWPGVSPGGVPGIVGETSSNGDESHFVTTGTIPEPSTWIMLVTAGLIVPAYARWGRRRA